MNKIALSIPGFGKLDSPTGLPQGVPTGGIDMGQKAVGVTIQLILIGAIFIAIFFIIRAGINMMTSGGDKQKFHTARERIRYVIIGLVIIFLSFAIVNLIGRFFGVNLLVLYK